MRQLFHTPVLHFDDANGRPLVGGRLYSYKAGTSTPVNLFRNETGSEVHTNPIVLNMRGECVAYGVEGLLYKLVLKDRHDVTIWERDNVGVSTGEGGGGGGGMQPTCKVQYNEDGLDVYSDEFDFVKENVLGNDELSFPRGWYQVNVCVTLENQAARDLVHDFKIDWSFERIENGSPVFFDAHLPNLKTQLDCTTTWTMKLYGSMLFVPYGTQDGDWLTYSIDIPSNMTYAIDLDIAKVRDE